MIARITRALNKKDGDKGFTLVELLVVVIIIGILAAISVPLYLDQQKKAFDASVKSDLKNYSTTAATYYTDALTYPSTPAGFAANGATTPLASERNAYIAFVDTTGTDAGFVIYGKNDQSGKVWRLSSYDGAAPKDSTLTALPTAVQAATLTGAPASVTFVSTSWKSASSVATTPTT